MSTYHFDVGERARLEVRIASGRVDIEVGEPGRVSVEVDGPAASAVEVRSMGDTVVVGRSDSGMAGARMRVSAKVPLGAGVDLSAASASGWLSGELGPVSVRSASGSVSVERAASLRVKTASGDVKVEEVSGDLSVASASGDVLARRVGGDIELSSMSGDLRVEEAGGEVRVNTASGDVRVDRVAGSEVSVKSVSGDVHLGILAGTRVDADINTLSGRIRVPERREGAEAEPERHLRVRLRSVSGDIAISRV